MNDGNNAGVRVNEVALAGIYFLGLGGGERDKLNLLQNDWRRGHYTSHKGLILFNPTH